MFFAQNEVPARCAGIFSSGVLGAGSISGGAAFRRVILLGRFWAETLFGGGSGGRVNFRRGCFSSESFCRTAFGRRHCSAAIFPPETFFDGAASHLDHFLSGVFSSGAGAESGGGSRVSSGETGAAPS